MVKLPRGRRAGVSNGRIPTPCKSSPYFTRQCGQDKSLSRACIESGAAIAGSPQPRKRLCFSSLRVEYQAREAPPLLTLPAESPAQPLGGVAEIVPSPQVEVGETPVSEGSPLRRRLRRVGKHAAEERVLDRASSAVPSLQDSSLSLCTDKLACGSKSVVMFEPMILQVRFCPRLLRESARLLLCRRGWPGKEDGVSRHCIAEFLGLDALRGDPAEPEKKPLKKSTFLMWCGVPGVSDAGSDSVSFSRAGVFAAAILNIYRFKGTDPRRCGSLEFVASGRRGAGAALIVLARQFLRALGIPSLFSAADLSRPGALEAHSRWGFQVVSNEVWSKAGLRFYIQGNVRYMKLDVQA